MQGTYPHIPQKHPHFRPAVCSVWDKGYRYGFNGMDKDNELSGNGNSYTTEFRQLDVRLGRWFSIDPVFKSYISLYSLNSNNPLVFIDPKGDDDFFDIYGNFLGTDNGSTNNIRIIPSAHIIMSKNFYLNVDKKIINPKIKEVQDSKLISDYDKFNNVTSGKMLISILNFYFKENVDKNMSHLVNNSLSFGYFEWGIDEQGFEDYQLVFHINNGGGSGMMNTRHAINGKHYISITSRSDIGLSHRTSEKGVSNNKYDFINTMVHENFHAKNHTGKIISNGTKNEKNTDQGLVNHLQSFEAQINHESWNKTSKEYKKDVKKSIKNLVNLIENDNTKKEQKAKFQKLNIKY